MQFFDKDDFDPVEYLKKNTLLCRKFNYAVPENYGSSNVILSFNLEKDRLDIFNVDHLVNRSDKDDSDAIKQPDRTLFRLDKHSFSMDLKKVRGFIYGPFATRFWMMRIGIN